MLSATATPSPFPVAVSGSLGTDWSMFCVTLALATITLLFFFATLSMANKTSLMAEKTAELAQDTVDASDRADVHHQQTLWPHLVALDAKFGYGNSLILVIKNIGGGPAVHSLFIALSTEFGECVPNSTIAVGPLGAGDTRLRPEFNAIDLDILKVPSSDWLYFGIEYESIFGSKGMTRWQLNRRTGTLSFCSPTKYPDIVKNCK